VVLGEKLAEYGGELVRALHVGEVSAVREQRQLPLG
jgi:hypothetical protein